MRVFVTGATGGIGSVLVPELAVAGHEVVGLARSEQAARALAAAGVEPMAGDLSDPTVLRAGAAGADGVVHLAFGHDFTRFDASVAEETLAVEAFAAALEGTGKPLVVASGTPVVPGRPSTEDDPSPTDGPAGGRGRTARLVVALAGRGIRSAVVRLPRSVHAAGGPYGLASVLVDAARRSGFSGVVGDGTQRWPAVHRLDAARLFRLVLEEGEPGTVVHAVADEGDPMLALAEVIGRRLGVPTRSVPADTFGLLGQLFAMDQPASSALTRERFGWVPTHPSLLDDLGRLEAGGEPS